MPLFSATLTIAIHIMLVFQRHAFPLFSRCSELCLQTHFPYFSLLSYLHLDDCSGFQLLILPRSVYSPPPGFSFSIRSIPKVSLMQKPLSVLSSSPLWSADRVHLLVPQTIGLPWTNIVLLQWLALCCDVNYSKLKIALEHA